MSEDMTLAKAADTWLAAKEARVSRNCHMVYASYIGLWKKHFKARTKLRSVDSGDIEKYLAGRTTAARSRNNERTILRMFFGACVRHGWITRNPAEAVEKFRETKRRIRTLSENDEARLLRVAREHDELVYGFVLTLVRSGLRRGTVGKLEWSDIDFSNAEWRIPGAKMKSREDFNGRPVAADLLAWLRERRRPAGLVFGRLDAEDWKTIVAKADLKGLMPHDLRRTFVTRCRRKGVPMEVTMFLSDHRNVAVVLECYREVDPDEAREAMATLLAPRKAAEGSERKSEGA